MHRMVRCGITKRNFMDGFRKAGQEMQAFQKQYVKENKIPYEPNKIAEFGSMHRQNSKIYAKQCRKSKVGNDSLEYKPFGQIPRGVKVDQLVTDASTDLSTLTKGKVSILLTCFKQHGNKMIQTWNEELKNVDAPIIQLHVVEEWYFRILRRMLRNGLAKQVPSYIKSDSIFTAFGFYKEFRSNLEMKNSFVGYIHVIGPNGKVYWRSTGNATKEEIEQVKECLKYIK